MVWGIEDSAGRENYPSLSRISPFFFPSMLSIYSSFCLLDIFKLFWIFLLFFFFFFSLCTTVIIPFTFFPLSPSRFLPPTSFPPLKMITLLHIPSFVVMAFLAARQSVL